VTNVRPGESVTLSIDGTPYATQIADADGTTVFSVPITAAMAGSPHSFAVFGADFACATVAVGVEAFETARGGTNGGGGVLARTGIEIALLVLLGLALVVAGYLVVREARRRRRRKGRQLRHEEQRRTRVGTTT
jgi:hypothetical protein